MVKLLKINSPGDHMRSSILLLCFTLFSLSFAADKPLRVGMVTDVGGVNDAN
jgi:hypothetical protein